MDASAKSVPGRSPLASLSAQPAHSKQSAAETIGKSSGVQYVAQKPVFPKTIDYSRFLTEDPNGQIVLSSAMREVVHAARNFHRKNSQDKAFSLKLRTPIPIDGKSDGYPAPSTRDWQNKIGNHKIRLEAEVRVRSEGRESFFEIILTITAEPLGNPKFSSSAVDVRIPDVPVNDDEIQA